MDRMLLAKCIAIVVAFVAFDVMQMTERDIVNARDSRAVRLARRIVLGGFPPTLIWFMITDDWLPALLNGMVALVVNDVALRLRRPGRGTRIVSLSLVRRAAAMGLAGGMLLVASVALGDNKDGRWNGSPLQPWFESLRNKQRVPCCDGSDAMRLADVDWQSKDGRYQVRLGGRWIDVPPEAVIEEPNKAGQTLVWPYYLNGELQAIRCFMPGVMM